MTLRRWFHLFWTTLLIGIVAGGLSWLVMKGLMDELYFLDDTAAIRKYELIFVILGAGTISVLSQMGFFAYLVLRYIVSGFLKKRMYIWNLLQIFLVLFALYDVVYLRYVNFATADDTLLDYMVLPVVITMIGVAVAYWKVKLTNGTALIPTLFFMIAVTIFEAVPALQENVIEYIVFMFAVLIACNSWQILTLQRILEPKTKS